MRILYLRLFLTSLFLVVVCAGLQAKSWREITPMKSTRADVVRVFNHCSGWAPRCDFQDGDDWILIEFSGNATANAHECSNELAPDTVLLIEVTPSQGLTFEDPHLNRKSFKVVNIPSDPRIPDTGYINAKEGLLLRTHTERTEIIGRIDYVAAADDTALCKSYYDDLEQFVDDFFTHPPPTIYLSIQTTPVHAGEKIVFTANADDMVGRKRSFVWTISGGKIVSQTNHELTVDTTGLEGKTLIVTAEFPASAVVSSKVEILP